MSEFFRIAHDIDRLDLAVLDFEGRRLWHSVEFGRHETGQAVDHPLIQEGRELVFHMASNSIEETADLRH